ncbi:hypothetical protein CYMTET_25579 [Cymbomonas tetramitiformis]|uniref:Uncharacterized protein n=1 Tax=Cymbomonas tetramitiformis TaxID=36881 RepID=A0AAE0FTT3_9CHLO|nr:hypothetical protein CYMTET_25579 [Cymbomonas tetramitiformis]
MAFRNAVLSLLAMQVAATVFMSVFIRQISTEASPKYEDEAPTVCSNDDAGADNVPEVPFGKGLWRDASTRARGICGFDQPESPLNEYIRFHHAALHRCHAGTCGDVKFLVWQCTRDCGGNGDRLKKMFTALLGAVVQRRVLLLNWPMPSPLEEVFLEAWVQWSYESSSQFLYNRSTVKLPQEDDDDEELLSGLWDADVIVVDGEVAPVFSRHKESQTPYLRDTMAKLKTVLPTGLEVGCAFHMLFLPSAALSDRLTLLHTTAFVDRSPAFVVGVHFRQGDLVLNVDGFQQESPSHFPNFIACARRHAAILARSAAQPERADHAILLIADDVDFKRHAAATNSDVVITDVKPCHVDKGTGKMHLEGGRCSSSQHLDTWSEQLLLAFAPDHLVLSRSGFSATAASLGMASSTQRTLGYNCGQCIPATGMVVHWLLSAGLVAFGGWHLVTAPPCRAPE